MTLDSSTQPELTDEELVSRLRECGVTGAGGAGFPTYVKWQNLSEVDCLMVNLQEGEPGFYGDRWLVNNNLDLYQQGLEYMLENHFRLITIGSKEKYRAEWLTELESNLELETYESDELPVPAESKTGLVLALTGPRYEISQETALLWTVAGQQIGQELPTEHGWLVQNAETFFNISRALFENQPVLKKQLVVYGPEIPCGYFRVPVGTRVSELFELMDLEALLSEEDLVLLDGGPGWCSEVDASPEEYGVTKRTNGILVADRAFVEEYRDPQEPSRINALADETCMDGNFPGDLRTPTPEVVSVPLISNPDLEGTVKRSVPVVESGEWLEGGAVVAKPAAEGISNYQHASVTGTVREVTAQHVVIER